VLRPLCEPESKFGGLPTGKPLAWWPIPAGGPEVARPSTHADSVARQTG
jgi:hypothetical protein